MNPLVQERIQPSAGHSAFRESLRWVFLGIFMSLTVLGCRSVGTTSKVATSVSLDERTATGRRSPFWTAHSRRSNRLSSVARDADTSDTETEDETDEENNDSAEVDDMADFEKELPPVRTKREKTSSPIKQAGGAPLQPVEDDPDRDSFIKILSFSDDDASKVFSDDNQSADPSELPPSPDDSPKPLRLTIPPEIPGAASPRLRLPAMDELHPEIKRAAIDELFPLLENPKGVVPPADRRMTLEELEGLALQNSPLIAQALASITMSQGTTIQSSLYPNPILGYESDTVGSGFTRNYQGIYLAQQIKVAGKLGLQRSAANMDLANSQLSYDKTRQEVLHQVRVGYFNVLVAQESSRINEALVRFTNEVYVLMLGRLKRGEQSPYEAVQLRTLAKQAYTAFRQSQNRYFSAWKQLAVSTGTPELPFSTLEGRADQGVPNLNYDVVLDRILTVHPDLQAARNLLAQAKYQLRLQKAIPVPDPTVAGVFQNDSTVPGFQRTSYNLNVSIPVPLYDRNQGNIRNALGKVEMNSRLYAVATNDLTNQLADAFERYQNGRVQCELSRTQILPDLARVYRGVYEAHINFPQKVGFSDIIVAQQNLSMAVGNYIGALAAQWVALADIANLMQLDDFHSLLNSTFGATGSMSDGVPPAATQEGGPP